MIYADPPFNKSKDFHAKPDSLASGSRFEDRWVWEDDVHEEWEDTIRSGEPGVHAVIEAAKLASGMDMAAYLCWLGVRLLECRRVLAETGSIYLHIDHTAHAWVKALMDAIFGRKRFKNEIVWCYAGGGQSKRFFPRKHDTILFYTKCDKWTFNPDDVRVPYDSDYTATVFAGEDTRAPGKTYVPNPKGKVVEDWWRNIPRPYGEERTGFPTQKPLALLDRVIKASSNPGDMVLDPFVGCATTPIAAEKLGRRWIGMDIWEDAHKTVLDRLRKEELAVPDADYEGQDHLIKFGDVHCTSEPPERTDDRRVAVVDFQLKGQRVLDPWEKLTTQEMRDILQEAQAPAPGSTLVVCAGCGRVLERPFLELDHNVPKSAFGENVITNRLLICRPCNGHKGNIETITGLWKSNIGRDWMADGDAARDAYAKAIKRGQQVKDEMRH